MFEALGSLPTRLTRLLAFALTLGSAGVLPSWASPVHPQPPQPRWRVIVHASNHVQEVRREELADLFLKKVTRWKNGKAALPVEQSVQSEIRRQFSEDVLRRSVLAVQNYWQQQMFSGRDAPPIAKGSDADVIQFVQDNDGAIGYVTTEASLSSTVKVLRVAP